MLMLIPVVGLWAIAYSYLHFPLCSLHDIAVIIATCKLSYSLSLRRPTVRHSTVWPYSLAGMKYDRRRLPVSLLGSCTVMKDNVAKITSELNIGLHDMATQPP